MKELTINSFSEFIQLLEEESSYSFRGVSKSSYKLIPSIARDWTGSIGDLKYAEEVSLRELKTRGVAHIDFRPSNDLEWLILGQHHGMQTRLLDWTRNPLVALYFSCFENYTTDGAVYTFTGAKYIDYAQVSNPLEIDENYFIEPPHISPRIAAQAAHFTISNNPLVPLEEIYTSFDLNGEEIHRILKIIVKAESKEAILYKLHEFGISPASLFPGLDGLCKDISYNALRLKSGLLNFEKLLKEKPDLFDKK